MTIPRRDLMLRLLPFKIYNTEAAGKHTRLGQILKKGISKLGQEFLYYFSEIWLTSRFLGVELISSV